jgi:hypothetical protein
MLSTSARSDMADPPSSARDLDDYLTMTSNRSIMLYLLQLILDGSAFNRYDYREILRIRASWVESGPLL